VTSSSTNSGTVAGGNGGTGGFSGGFGGGGGGGAGGYGAVLNGSGLTYTNNGTVSGGNGGAGGSSGSAFGGNGGDAGIGVDFTGSGTLNNSGTIVGGAGGAGGAGSSSGTANGNPGAGGAGIVGGGLTVINSGTITGGLGGNGVTRANAITFTGGINSLTLQAGSTITGNVVAFSTADTLALGGSANASFDVSQIGVQYLGFGIFVKTGSSTWTLTNTTTAVTPWTINQGTLAVSSDGNLGNASGGLTFNGGTLQFLSGFTSNRTITLNAGGGSFDTDGNTATLGGMISGVGGLAKIGTGTLTLTGTDTYTGGTTISAGTLQIGNGGTTGSIAGNVIDNAMLAFDRSDTLTFGGTISGVGGLAKIGTGTLILTGTDTYTGGTTISAGTLQIGNGGTTGSIAGNVIDNATLAFDRSDTLTFGGMISGSGGLSQIGSGTLVLTGSNAYTGATNVLGGALEVDGSIATSSLTTVANGALLTGTGTVGKLQVNGGAMFAPGTPGAPGTSMTVAGNLAFQPGAQYFVFLNPSTSSFANVTGTASLNGTVDAVFAPGSYVSKQYTILQSAGLDGTTFSGLTNINLPAGFIDSLSYNADDVFLNLTAALGLGTPLNQNQQAVATTINNFFNSGGALPPNFVGVFGLTGSNLANALTQLDGEDATGAERGAFQLMNEFLGLMLDPFVYGRGGGNGGGPALGFAPDQPAALPPDIALAYAGVLKAPPKQTFEQRWAAWGSGFGGSARTNGDPIVGSNNVTTGTFGYAAGMDYHYSPDTVLGFALAGGGTNWNLAQGLGTGRSDAFLAGIYGVTHQGPAYIGGALAFANNWFTTNRTALGDQLSASFQGQSYAARLEGGYRFVAPLASNTIGITPYAAIQAQNFHTPSYRETDLTAGGFGLSYAAMNGTDTRSELGGRFDDLAALGAMPLVLRAKLAWAHDWVSNPALNVSFEALPGSGFTVFGAPIPHDSALTSAGAQLFFTPNWSFLARFDGDFAKGSQAYAGTGTLRYTW
jgi:autotransporter-associated beta strand protein